MTPVNDAILLLTEIGYDLDRLADQSTLNFIMGAPDAAGHHPDVGRVMLGLVALSRGLASDLGAITGRSSAEVLRNVALREVDGP